ncbi:hypothetical protein Nos7524_3579 [Nostoc sp. PCC 7524]|uniref:hypothetical protein n=1 Tax=Nostoc sp. (strain ATCC 29411 / PCC 7524) TaxID=28072 RepID=UPI00029F11A1|nr:hypothetical protein [Nostoc sp. PCC 7524]AFY49370.1 hypothetical protein Nos7524_3579 [Nostoc sp. PCC 7524]
MNKNNGSESAHLPEKLHKIAAVVHDVAQGYQGDVMALLQLLRQLEQLHREIRDGAFQESLPNNRQHLYALLKDIESEGGWPYIERMRLQAFLRNFLLEAIDEDSPQDNSDDMLSGDRSFT